MITIIVMLILVTVTISISLNGGLFGYAKRAVKETNQALTEEEMLANGMIKIDGVWYKSMDEYLKNPTITTVPEADKGKWDYIHNGDGTITLTQYNGTETDLIVPNRYEGYVVTKVQNDKNKLVYVEADDCYKIENNAEPYNIMGKAAENTNNIKSVKISDGVEIGALAFFKVSSLTNIEMGKYIDRIGTYAFRETGITKLEIGASLRKIDVQAFAKCENLKTLDLSNASELERIGGAVFANCSELTGNLEVPNKLKQIQRQAFYKCSKLTSIDLSKATLLEDIGDYAFANCTGLTGNLEIPNKVKQIGKYAFYKCSKLTGLDLNKATSLENIGEWAFTNCTGLKGTLVIPSKVKEIQTNAFGACSGLASLDLSKATSLENIGKTAFSSCSGLTGKLIIPSSVKQIGKTAFQNCSKITGVELNEGLEYIGNFAFNHLSRNLETTIKIPSTVKQIGGQEYTGDSNVYGSHIFYDCGNYTAFEVAEGNTAYKAVDGVLYNKAGTILVAYPQGKTGNKYEIPEGVTKIDELAFNRNGKLKTIVLPDSYEIKSTDEMPEGDYKINIGNNLAIGIYDKNVVANVEVKSTNTRYKSENGMVLSKDGTILYYIPVKNAGTGTIEIPSTVTKIYKGAIYGYESDNTVTNYYSATKIIIPAGCIEIEETNFKVINKGTWTIEVASGNTKYEVGSDGKLVAK